MSDVIYHLQAKHTRHSPVFVIGFPRPVLAGQEVLAYTKNRRDLKRFARTLRPKLIQIEEARRAA